MIYVNHILVFFHLLTRFLNIKNEFVLRLFKHKDPDDKHNNADQPAAPKDTGTRKMPAVHKITELRHIIIHRITGFYKNLKSLIQSGDWIKDRCQVHPRRGNCLINILHIPEKHIHGSQKKSQPAAEQEEAG